MSSVCRICLAGNTSLQSLKNNHISFYEKLTNAKFHSEDARPRALCCYCYQKLLRCHTFSQMAVRSEKIFNHLYESDLEVTHEYITEVKLNMKQHLSVATNVGSQVTIKEEPLPTDIDIKEEVTTQPDTLLEVESFLKECIKNQITFKEDIIEQMFVDEMDSRSSPSVMTRQQSRQGTTAESSSSDPVNSPEYAGQRSPQPGHVDGTLAVCKYCGYTGFDVSRCERCKRIFTKEHIRAPRVTKKLNKRRREPERVVIEKRRIRGRNNTVRKIGTHTADQMKMALDAIKAGISIRQAATEHGIAFSTLRRYNTKNNPDQLTPNYSVRKIFKVEHEEALRDYCLKYAKMFYGLTTKVCRQIAYDMAKMNNIPIPESWEANKMAGIDWLRGFRERFPDMTLRKLEKSSLGRATAFNMLTANHFVRETVKIFFDNLENVLSSPAFVDGTRIYKLDKTATSILLKNHRIVDPKNICKMSSSEKGTLVTTCNIISAGGVALPPALVFPRKNINPRMEVGTPPGSLILSSPTGWMSTENFVQVMKHFVLRSGSTKDFPTVLIMDNHESHISIQALNLAEESGVTVLILPPHTSAKNHPLDVFIHGPFKSYYSSAMESWMMRNPGCSVTIYNIGVIISQAFEKCMTPINIMQSFRKTGIYPFDRNILSDDDFVLSSVTDKSSAE